MLGYILLLLGGLGTPEIILIALVVLLLFGGKKIPELMHGVGKGVKSFKEGMAGLEDELNKPSPPSQPDPSKTPDKDKPVEKAG